MASTPEESTKVRAAARSVPTPASAAKSVPTPAATASTVFMPISPRFGGIKEVSKDSFVPWTGGEPQGNWFGLANPTVEVEPNQYRLTSPTSAGNSSALPNSWPNATVQKESSPSITEVCPKKTKACNLALCWLRTQTPKC